MTEPLSRFMGDQFFWFVGVVECILDPEKLGRVKVRVLGDHTQDKSEIPTKDLPWAMPMMPFNSASMNGIGDSPTGIVVGSWVIGFYIDKADKQQPFVLGTFGGFPMDPASPAIGFNDFTSCFPQVSKLEEPDTNRHARGIVGKHTITPKAVESRMESIVTNIATATMSWSEPMTSYMPIYPYNKVWEGPYNPECDECEWGHLEEWDSTPGAERYFRQHKTSQNFLEIHPDGKEVRKIYGDGFEIDLGSKHLYIEGDYRVTIQGNKDEHIVGDYWQYIEGDMIRVIDGDKIVTTKGKDSTTVEGTCITRSKEDIYQLTEKNAITMANESIDIFAGDKIKVMCPTEATVAIAPYSPITIEPLVPDPVSGSTYPVVVLKCDIPNEIKSNTSRMTQPSIPAYDVTADATAVAQLKLVPDKYYIDVLDIHVLGETYFKEDANFNENVLILKDLDVIEYVFIGKSINVVEDTLMNGSCHVGDTVYAGSNVEVGAELHAPGPIGIDPTIYHTYIVPTPGAAPNAADSPTDPDPFEIPDKAVISDAATIPDKVYAPNDKTAIPVIPPDYYECE